MTARDNSCHLFVRRDRDVLDPVPRVRARGFRLPRCECVEHDIECPVADRVGRDLPAVRVRGHDVGVQRVLVLLQVARIARSILVVAAHGGGAPHERPVAQHLDRADTQPLISQPAPNPVVEPPPISPTHRAKRVHRVHVRHEREPGLEEATVASRLKRVNVGGPVANHAAAHSRFARAREAVAQTPLRGGIQAFDELLVLQGSKQVRDEVHRLLLDQPGKPPALIEAEAAPVRRGDACQIWVPRQGKRGSVGDRHVMRTVLQIDGPAARDAVEYLAIRVLPQLVLVVSLSAHPRTLGPRARKLLNALVKHLECGGRRG